MAKLQVALDFVDLSRAVKCAKAAAAGGADIFEAGTPLIKSEGLNAVRELKRLFPRAGIVADMKTIDTGRMEMEAAAKAGATTATVMGTADFSTIEECVEAGRNYGIKVAVDLLGIANPVAFARRCEEIGVDEVGVHTPIDEQMRGGTPFEILRAVRKAADLRISVAGGINTETAGLAVKAGADIVIVGGAINKAKDVTAATKAVKKAMSTGKAIKTELFRRVKDADAIKVLRKVSTPNISDAMHRGGSLRGLVRFSGTGRMVGRAITVRTYPGDWAKPVEAIDIAGPGDVIVVDAGGQELAVWGELATESCVRKKIAGIVIDGAIRDVEEVRELGFDAWARFANPTALEAKGFGEINVPIEAGGIDIAPGDVIVGDDSGIVRIPKAKLAEITNRSMSCLEAENRIREEIREGGTLSSVVELLRWEKK